MADRQHEERSLLVASELFRSASDALADALMGLAQRRRLDGGATLFHKGDPSDALYIVRSGQLEVSVLSADGRKLTLNSLRPPEIFGEIALFDGGPRTATIAALEPSELLEVRRTDVFRAMRRQPEIAEELLLLAGRRLRWVGQMLEEKTFLPLRVRLARRILVLLDSAGDAGGDVIALSQTGLADHMGATRVAVANILGTWRQDGIVNPERGRLRISDRAALEDIALEEEFDGSV